MTTFTVSAVVRCSEKHCMHENDFCRYAHLRGLSNGTRNYCNLFERELVTEPGTPSPLRCSACLAAEKQIKGKVHEQRQ